MTQALPEFLKTVTISQDDLEFGREITVTHTEVVPVSADVYWSGFDDYFRLQEFVGMHENMTTIKGEGGVGTVIEFDFLGGRTQEELVQKDEATKTWAIAMLGSNPLFTTYKATVKVDNDTSETAKVTMSITGIVALSDHDKRKAHIAFTQYMLRNRINEILCLIADKKGEVLHFEVDVDCSLQKLWDAVNDWAGYTWVMHATGVEVVPDQPNYDLRRKVVFGPRSMEERLVMGTENPNSLEYEFGRNDNMRVLHYRGKVEVQKISDKKTKAKYTSTFLPQPGVDAKANIKALMETRLKWIQDTFTE
ncbi:uncharacterized protein [Branchiostoma lanceolatum]|uniref:Hypp9285 protein n=1 Tax=Branchiostoma lanceolatum TaxID=7740 RepID=A0A8J9ZEW6_BRALA|nr:Hypp9285 [Branchiostoma lanceolatum]